MNPRDPRLSPVLVQHFLESSAAQLPDKVALVCGGKRMTFSDLDQAAERLGSSLIDLGLQRQDRVSIFLENCAQSVISLFGILKARGTFIMLSPSMKSFKLNYILRDSGSCILISETKKQAIVAGAVGSLPDLEHIIWVGPHADIPGTSNHRVHHHGWDMVAGASTTLPNIESFVSNIDIDLATIIYTSGSTGEPKGVMSAHYNVISAVHSITRYLENTEDDIILCALPLSFDYGLYQVLMGAFLGATVVLERSFVFPHEILIQAQKENITGFPIVPTMAALLFKTVNLSRFALPSLRYISNTAAPLPRAYIQRLRATWPHARLYSMYGLTECKRVSYLPPEELDRRPDSVGIPIPNEEVFIVDGSGSQVPPGVVGELVIRGSNVMQGYWNDPDATARTFRAGRYRADALLYSGDLFKMDEDGFLYFVSRKDDLIKSKGERISPREIENVICLMDGVAQAAVLGIPDQMIGEAIVAFVVLSPGHQLDPKSITRHCMENLEAFMVPKFIHIRDSLPTSPAGKIDKKLLRFQIIQCNETKDTPPVSSGVSVSEG